MTLRKVTIDNSVKHIPQSEQTREIDNTPKVPNNNHFLVNKIEFH